MPGIRTSMITTSGLRRAASSTAEAPSAASPTTRMCGARESESRSPSRTTSWSSTISAVISSGMARASYAEDRRDKLLGDSAAAAAAPGRRSRIPCARASARTCVARRLGVGRREIRAARVEALVVGEQLGPVAREALEEVLPRAGLQIEQVRPDPAGAGLARGRDDAPDLIGRVREAGEERRHADRGPHAVLDEHRRARAAAGAAARCPARSCARRRRRASAPRT